MHCLLLPRNLPENFGHRRQNDSCPSWPDLAMIQLTEFSGIFSIRYPQSWTNLLGTLLRLIGLVEEEVGSQLLVLVAGEVGLDHQVALEAKAAQL